MSTNDPHWWIWSFGDGDTSNAKHPYKKYSTDNTYTVCLRAINLDGWDDTCGLAVVENVGMAEFAFMTDFRIYPNPTQGEFVIRSVGNQRVSSVAVYNMMGELVSSGSADALNTRKKTKLDLSGNPSGLYFVKIEAGGSVAATTVNLTD